ncbi:Hypothetical predicted protein [Mytilus galloprovincialis]|uniref:C2H2-type domain-containing protein n=1 Tax=Mytilus galloprovincialis TaxID=29158 RepID=A0A8B6HG71_MYTGA|nr:Hypothetical predicted protein [Mytilus galloprovincialis]
MISFEVNNNTCDPYISRPRRQRHDSGRHFDSNGPTERHLDIRGVLEILRKNENYTGGVNCAVCGKLYKSRVCFIKHIWEHTVYWDEFDGAKNHERVLSIQAALILHTGFQELTLEESNQLENLLVTSPNEKKESEYGSPDFKRRPKTPKKSPWKRKKSFEL